MNKTRFFTALALLVAFQVCTSSTVLGQLIADRLYTTRPVGSFSPDTLWTAIAISGDGSTIVGYWRTGESAELLGAWWTAEGDMQSLGSLPGAFSFVKQTIFLNSSSNGAVALGSYNLDGLNRALAWSEATGLVDLTTTYELEGLSARWLSPDRR